MTLAVGVIGFSEGNGHPYSFSAIINGFSDDGMTSSGWIGIRDYLRRRDLSEFGGLGMRVTHAWTQDEAETERLCRACRIENRVSGSDPLGMLGAVDAVILARDDHHNHASLALPFLEAGVSVFVDKPLTMDLTELRAFAPFLEAGSLMSCSGMRFAQELDTARASLDVYGELRLVRGTILNDWARYGVHMVDAVLGLTAARPVSVVAVPASHQSLAVQMDGGCLFQVDALGAVQPCFELGIYGTKHHSTHSLHDNFSMFRRLLYHFARSVVEGVPGVPPADTLAAVRLLIAGQQALEERRAVRLDELAL